MKSIQVGKIVAIGVLLVAGLATADAQTQTQMAYLREPASTAKIYAVATDSAPAVESQSYRSPVVMRGGYNVGRSAVDRVPGCNGPASLCNLYFGN
jgi:hypothetical protein